MKEKFDVVVIGAGAAGMTAAIFAARGASKVCVIEHRSEPGKKILQTGNGRCNLTHETVKAEDYGFTDKYKTDFLKSALKNFGVKETLAFFDSLGVPVRNKGGYIYPYSCTALSVRNALWDEMKRLGIEILVDTCVKSVSPVDTEFKKNTGNNQGAQAEFSADVSGLEMKDRERASERITCKTHKGERSGFLLKVRILQRQDAEEHVTQQIIYAKKLILATGLCAAPKTGSDGTGIELASKLGLNVKTPLPSLVKLKCRGDFCKPASGVRHISRVEIIADGKVIAEDTGEVQFTDDGISGIPVFNVSGDVSEALHEGRLVSARLDLLPDITKEQCEDFIEKKYDLMQERKISGFFGGLLPVKLLTAVARSLGISAEKRTGDIGMTRVGQLLTKCKKWELEIKETYGFDHAQVCRGGVDLSRLDPETMQVKETPGLFIAGELADIDGPCGGYNLQWAWTSGAIAGRG